MRNAMLAVHALHFMLASGRSIMGALLGVVPQQAVIGPLSIWKGPVTHVGIPQGPNISSRQ